MEIQWSEFIDVVKDESTKEIFKKLQSISMDAAKSGSEYALSQCKLVYKYMKQNKDGEITEEEFKSLLTDLADIMKLESLKANMATRQLVAELVDICLKVVKNSIGLLIVF